MTLYDYLKLMPKTEELTVWDADYDLETYFYGAIPNDKWSKSILELSKILTIETIKSDGVIVNLTEVVERNINKLKKADLFIRCDIDSIMDDMDNILAGNVSGEWLREFVKALK